MAKKKKLNNAPSLLNTKRRNIIAYVFFSLFIIICQHTWALSQHEKLWLAINSQQIVSENKKWHSFIYSQLRTINESHPVQAGLVEGGIGYHFLAHNSFWFGYRWTGIQPNNGFYQENRLFQQFIWQPLNRSPYRIIHRSRLEEIERTDQSQISFRFRERIALDIDHLLFSRSYPFIYDEVFFQLNDTSYTSSRFVSENRLFIGMNMFVEKQTWWEIGYINQYQMHTPLNTQNQMSHIASVTYNML